MPADSDIRIDQFPDQPGIYLMKDRRGEIIYVGKAANLKKRVRSYFNSGRDESRLITRQLDEVQDIDFVVSSSEKEAFILENNFIKQFRPKYNVLLRDDKSFVSIKIPLREPYPRPIITRKIEDRRAKYFGPYSNSRAARETLKLLHEVFPLRKCTLQQFRKATRPCLYGQMGKCLAPCVENIPVRRYETMLEELSLFLSGRCQELLERMRVQMRQEAGRLNFEGAATVRDRIRYVEETVEKQLAASAMDRIDRDIFGYFPTDKNIWVAVLFVRRGRMQDAASYRFPADLDDADAILRSFINQFYLANRFIPTEILIPVDTGELNLLADWLSEKKGRKVKVLTPRSGRKKRLVELASRNAMQARKAGTREDEKRRLELESLQAKTALKKLPLTIECFDISNLSGREAAGSMVVFKNGVPEKGAYRRYRIKDARGRDDPAMMHEVIKRRYRHATEEKGNHAVQRMPELIVLDGGDGQLEAARRALKELGVHLPDIIALAKARTGAGRRIKRERVFVPGREGPIVLEDNSHACMLLTRIRDEAHRFAVQYHRTLRRKAFIESPLTKIPGIGTEIAARLLDRFKSLERVKKADIDDLCAVKGISQERARVIIRHIEKHWH